MQRRLRICTHTHKGPRAHTRSTRPRAHTYMRARMRTAVKLLRSVRTRDHGADGGHTSLKQLWRWVPHLRERPQQIGEVLGAEVGQAALQAHVRVWVGG